MAVLFQILIEYQLRKYINNHLNPFYSSQAPEEDSVAIPINENPHSVTIQISRPCDTSSNGDKFTTNCLSYNNIFNISKEAENHKH